MPGSSIFISYGREDADAARRVYRDLKDAGLDPWLDVECLKPGQQWRLEIRRAIRKCRYFLVLLSTRTTSRRGFVHKELTDALDLLDSYPDSEIYLLPVRLDDCEPPRDRLRDLHWTDMFPNWDAGLAKLRSSLVLSQPEPRQDQSPATHSAVVIVLEKYRDTSAAASHAKSSVAEIYFSVKNTGAVPVVIYDLGLEEVDAGSVTVPAPHSMSCRVKLEASLARKGQNGETIPLFSCFCHDCYVDRLDFRTPLTSDLAHELMLTNPRLHEAALFFHSVLGDDSTLELAPAESESFVLRLNADAGCTKVATEFRICAQFHDISGSKHVARAATTYAVDFDHRTAHIRLGNR